MYWPGWVEGDVKCKPEWVDNKNQTIKQSNSTTNDNNTPYLDASQYLTRITISTYWNSRNGVIAPWRQNIGWFKIYS